MIRADVRLTAGHFRTLNRGIYFRLFFTAAVAILVAVIILPSCIRLLSYGWKHGVIGIFGLSFLIWIGWLTVRLIVTVISAKKRYLSEAENQRTTLTFTDDEFVFAYENSREMAERHYKYGGVKSAFRRKGYFIIATANLMAILSSADLVEGTHAELEAMLREKLGNRFKEAKK